MARRPSLGESFHLQNITRSDGIPIYYEDKNNSTKIKSAFNAVCGFMIAIGGVGIANEFGVFGGSDGTINKVDIADTVFYGVTAGAWMVICAIGNIAFCQRDRIASPYGYKRTCYNRFCPARFEQKVDRRDEQPMPTDDSPDTTPCWLEPCSHC